MKADRTIGTYIAAFVRLGRALRPSHALKAGGLVALAWLCLVAGSGLYPLLAPEEARHAGIVHDMWAARHYLMPRADGFPILDGAPLYYWISLGFLALLGPHEWVLRLPSAVCALLLLLSISWLFPPPGPKSRALLALLFLLQPAVLLGARYASPDMLGLLLLTLVLGSFWQAMQKLEAAGWAMPRLLAAWGALGLLGLAAGPLAVLPPVCILAGWLLCQGRLYRLSSLCPWPALLLFVIVLLPWWVWVETRYPGMAATMLYRQAFRLIGEGRQLWAGLAGGRSGLLVLVASLPLMTCLYRYHDPARRAALRTPLASLMGLWLVVMVVCHPWMSLSPVGHMLALLVPLLVFAVQAMSPALPQPWWLRYAAWVPPVLAAALTAVLGLAALLPTRSPIAPVKALMGRHYIPATDKVIMLDRFDYDFNFYMRTSKLVSVATTWEAHEGSPLPRWVKDLSQSARFVPETAARLLWHSQAASTLEEKVGEHPRGGAGAALPDSKTLFDRLCERRVVNLWIVSNSDGLQQYPVLGKLLPFAATDDLRVWYLEAGRSPSYCRTYEAWRP